MPAEDAPTTIGPMDLERDLDGILAVDRASFTNPWTPDMIAWEARNSDVARVYVCRQATGVVGYCAAWHVFDELHINNLAVLPDRRRQGVARALLQHALSAAVQGGARRATLEVRASNHAARALYENFGFRLSGVRKAYYTTPTEDAVILWCDLPVPAT